MCMLTDGYFRLRWRRMRCHICGRNCFRSKEAICEVQLQKTNSGKIKDFITSEG